MMWSLSTLIRGLSAVLLAGAAWMAVTWGQDPFREDWLPQTIAVEATHLPAGLTEVGALGDIRIRIRASQDAWSRVSSGAFKASVDLSRLGSGLYSEDVKVETSGDYQLVDWSPRKVSVRLEPLIDRSVPVQLSLTGKLADGYVLTDQTLSPDHVTINGQQDIVQTVVNAVVGTTLDGARGDITETITPQLTDDKGQAVRGLQATPPTIRVSLSIARQVGVKTVPLRVSTTGQVAAGYWLSALAVSPQTATITGGPSALAQVDYIDLPALDISGAKADAARTTTVASGSGYSLVNAVDATVTASVSPLRGSEAVPIGVAILGVPQGFDARLSPATVEVTVGGLVPALSLLKPGDIAASVDVTGMTAGAHTVAVRLNAPASVGVEGTKPDRVTVTLSPFPTATAVPASPSATAVASAATAVPTAGH